MALDGKITFAGADGQLLAGRLDLPAGKPRDYALFAHCFTCTHNIFAAARIARGLKERGFAVLRFDFTGLGASEGDFANTNFSSNIADLVAAADHMRANLEAPALIIGHSLGGSAILAAANQIAEAKAVVTIGSPADVAHVAHNFGEQIAQIMTQGQALVELAGRPFTIQRQFIEDIEAFRLEDLVSRLGKALLILHAPFDQTVGIENAARIFGWARHPKSYVSLEGADHLLSRQQDAEYAADIIATWSAHYL